MAEAGKPSIAQLLNGPSQAPAPSPAPTPSPAPSPAASPQPSPAPAPAPQQTPAPPAGPQPPAAWPAPTPPAVGGGPGSIKYEAAALESFARTSDERANEFGQALQQAKSIKLGWNAFGVMFGQLCRAAYDKQAQAVSDGCTAGQQAMASIAAGVRQSAANVHAANQAIEQSAAQAGGHG